MSGDEREDPPERPPTIIQKAGDYAVQIAQNFGNVIVERSIYVFRDVKQVVAFLLILIALGLSITYFYWLSIQPEVMNGDFNIAFSEFVELSNTTGIDVAASTGKLIFSYLDDEYKLSSFEDVDVNYYDQIDLVQGAEEAEAFAEKVNADLVIYGDVTALGDEALISPKFYVTEAFRSDVGEMSGQHKLELPVRFEVKDLLDQDSEVSARLPQRMAILTEFTKGLVYIAADDLGLSLEAMENSIAYVEEYGIFPGAEVIFLLASNNARLQGDFALSQQYLDDAFYLNPDYGRAYIAQGNIYYDQLNFFRAADTYQQAIELEEQPYGAYIVEKASINLGNIYAYHYQEATHNPLTLEAEKAELAQEGLVAYQVVIDSYETASRPNSRLTDMAAWSQYGTGLIYQVQGDFEQAGQAFEQALGLTDDPDLLERARRRLEEVHPGGSS